MTEEVRNGRREKLVELGEMIRARRENLGLSIEEVQEQTKIRSKYLRAIEAGDDRIPPGQAYFRVFLKSYAEFLGLDGLEFSRAYREIVENNNRYRPPAPVVQDIPKATQARPRRRPRRRRGMGAVAKTLLALVLLAGVIFGITKLYGFYFARTQEPGGNTDPENGTVVEQPEPGSGEEVPEEPVTEVIVRREDPSDELTVFTINQTPFTVILKTFPEEGTRCWIQVQSDGEIVAEETMGPDQAIEVAAENEVRVRAGAPWVLALTLNGQDLGVGGPYGPVKDLIFRYGEEL
ncbi:MAG: DUF4115 domain-containing protein [Firmicutes bacterium]|jgi:cytoskeletal protein RodZ|nr:DUF4115 domain-containing protein [Candidatus Fermentithermobacillaceae bacterium]